MPIFTIQHELRDRFAPDLSSYQTPIDTSLPMLSRLRAIDADVVREALDAIVRAVGSPGCCFSRR